MTINEQLDMLEKVIKSNNTNEIENIKHKIIHPDNGAYFGLYIKHTNFGNGEFLFNDNIFSTKQEAIEELNSRKAFDIAHGWYQNEYEIRRVVVHETDIKEWL